ncbi:MAG: MFS transporter [Ardenticatenales bacterium]|nr:MFS transporter [Ardenticatenales bacterium]
MTTATPTLTDTEKIKRLPWLITGNVFNILFVLLTFEGSVFVLYLDSLGLDTAQIGVLLSIIPFANLVAPLVTPLTSRFGLKRSFVTFWGVRKLVMSLMLLTPAFLGRFGSGRAFYWVAAILLFFSLARSIAETGGFPWRKIVVPDAIRGKYTALNSMSTTVASIVIVAGAGYVIDNGSGLNRFMILIGIGIAAGILSVISYAQVPAELPGQGRSARQGHLASMRAALSDRNFVLFLLVLGLGTLGTSSLISFIPLYMKSQIGISEGVVVILSIGTYLGALLTSYLWGWTVDRYSSRPVMQTSLFMMMLLPVGLFILPRGNAASAPLAMVVAFVQGVSTLAWQISWAHYLYVGAMPEEKSTAYSAVYYAWAGIVGGTGPLLAGQILNMTAGLSRQIGPFRLDNYTPLFAFAITMMLLSSYLVTRLRSNQPTSFRQFAGMFLTGSPVRALGYIIRYNLTSSEMARVMVTERMGDSANPLSNVELIASLEDPSFIVRYEAIHSIGRMPANDELLEALIKVLDGYDSELSSAAARALGRLGDPRSIPALRQALHSEHRLLAANAARALSFLNAAEAVPELRAKLASEPSKRLQIAYAAALGKLGDEESVDAIFDLFMASKKHLRRVELGLALARISGDERFYLQHWRGLQMDEGTTSAQVLTGLLRSPLLVEHPEWRELLNEAAATLATGDLATGVTSLADFMAEISPSESPTLINQLFSQVAAALYTHGESRPELVLLALHLVHAQLHKKEQLTL